MEEIDYGKTKGGLIGCTRVDQRVLGFYGSILWGNIKQSNLFTRIWVPIDAIDQYSNKIDLIFNIKPNKLFTRSWVQIDAIYPYAI